MMRPKSENKVEGSSDVIQAGGDVTIGLTFEQHRDALREDLDKRTKELEKVHGAELELAQREANELRSRLANIEIDYHERIQELKELKAKLAQFENRFEKEKLEAAYAAIDRDDTTLAEALFKELLELAASRREDAERDEADIEFQLGKIAENKVRWADAAAHFARAARLKPSFQVLAKAQELALLAGRYKDVLQFAVDFADILLLGNDQEKRTREMNIVAGAWYELGMYDDAIRIFRQALDIAEKAIGTEHSDYAANLNNLAAALLATGKYDEAEQLFRKALEIGAATIGTKHPNYAANLNNLAVVLQETGKNEEAEELHRRAMDITADTIGKEDPAYAKDLHNLGFLLWKMGKNIEAEEMLRQALEVDAATIGTEHPAYAAHLNNLATMLKETGKYVEAEVHFRQAVKTSSARFGTAHSEYAICLATLAEVLQTRKKFREAEELYRQALKIFETELGAEHHNTQVVRRDLQGLIAERDGSSP